MLGRSRRGEDQVSDATSSTTSSILSNALATTYDSVSGSIQFTGLGSGTDFGEVVDQLVAIESIHMDRLEYWKSTWEAKIESFQALNERLYAVGEAAADMDTEAEFLSKSASVSDSTVVTASGSNSASIGAYNVEVGENVKQVLNSSGVATSTTDVVTGAGGNLVFEVDGASYTVAIGANDDLDTIASNINAVVGNPVTATVESDGTDSRPYRLVLTSNTGGNAGRINVTQNPTDLSFNSSDMAIYDQSGWGASEISLAGQFTGDSATASVYDYTFTVANSSNPSTIGTDSFEINWNASAGGGSGTIVVPADYTPGESLEVENGIYIQLGSGTVNDADTFSVRAYANDIDDAELTDWAGQPAITTSGNYLGTASKTYSFSVVTGGDIQDGGGADTVVLRWTDSTGRTGTVSIDDSAQTYEVDQGVSIQIAAGTLSNGKTFQVQAFAPIKQQGQDAGLAQVAKVVHAGFSDESTTAVTTADATFSYTYAGERVDVDVEGGFTLSQLVSAINNDADNPGVTASIINDGQGLPTSYRLVLTGQETGAQNQITAVSHDFTGSSFSNGGELGGGFDITQLATNSMVKVDGFPADADEYLQRDSNTVSDVITGVSLNLHDAGTAQITISTNTSAIYGKIEALVNAVNYAQEYIRTATKYDPNGEDTGILIGNYSYYIIKSRIDTALNSSVAGLDPEEVDYTHLSQIGIKTDPDADGAWTIDSTTLMNALNNNAEDVAKLFVNDTDAGTEGVGYRMYQEIETLTDSESGTLNVLIENYEGIIANIDDKIEYEEARIALYKERQTERFARLEATLAELEAMGKSIESQVAQLPSNSG